MVGGAVTDTVAIWDTPRQRWLPIADALAHPAAQPTRHTLLAGFTTDMVAFLAAGVPAQDAALVLADRMADESFAPDLTPRLPFAARSLRPFLLSPSHSDGVVRGMTARYAPSGGGARPAHGAESKAQPLMLRTPLLYQGNHNALVPDGTPVLAPPYGRDLDFELELGFVICRDLRNATEIECRSAIGGLVVLNDVSLRDTQLEEVLGSPLGPVNKCKSFATAMSSEVLTADEVLDDLAALTGTVEVDGKQWCSGRADDFAHSLEACLARACAGETLYAGELFSTGTLAGCSGIELGRLPPPGATVTLIVPTIGTLTNQLGRTPQ